MLTGGHVLAARIDMSEQDIRAARDYGTEIHRSWRRVLAPLWMQIVHQFHLAVEQGFLKTDLGKHQQHSKSDAGHGYRQTTPVVRQVLPGQRCLANSLHVGS